MRFAHMTPDRSDWRVAFAVVAVTAVVSATMFAQDPSAGGRGGRGAAPPNPLGQPLLDPAGRAR
jgi:hypothetical protein